MFVQVILCLTSFVSYIWLLWLCKMLSGLCIYVWFWIMSQNKAILFMYHSTNRGEHVPALYSPQPCQQWLFALSDQHFLMELEKRKILVFTPSRRVGGKRVVCYDDRFIVKVAYESDGVIVSNDTYRDLQGERPEWKKCIEERLLMFSFVNDK